MRHVTGTLLHSSRPQEGREVGQGGGQYHSTPAYFAAQSDANGREEENGENIAKEERDAHRALAFAHTCRAAIMRCVT